MSNYMYKSTALARVAAVSAWDTKRTAWNALHAKLADQLLVGSILGFFSSIIF
ncbi:hypothetical protein VRC24_12225 [Pseudomonas poae]|uniref:Uncharacterized protein n=1 Tax=Pseudomonas poae TaxID=200451 RepID=A0ABY0RBJ0_9PSED|nr:hypothetical protein [Pseudomonas poae]SDN52522.1 hypothetical protein SAMN04490208_0587 [Pseudomonas poae]